MLNSERLKTDIGLETFCYEVSFNGGRVGLDEFVTSLRDLILTVPEGERDTAFLQFSASSYDGDYTVEIRLGYVHTETDDEFAKRMEKERNAIEAEKRRLARNIAAAEERDRAEYARLKAKFEEDKQIMIGPCS